MSRVHLGDSLISAHVVHNSFHQTSFTMGGGGQDI